MYGSLKTKYGSFRDKRIVIFKSKNHKRFAWLFTKSAYYLLELTGPKELVLIALNRKVKTDPRNYSSDPCVDYTQEVM